MIFDAIGLLGVSFILLAYFLLQAERLAADAAAYSLVNLIGAALILISLIHTFNLASVVIELAWIVISLFGLAKAWRRRGGRA